MTPVFQWTCSGVERPELDYQQLEQWITQVAQRHNRFVGALTYIFCDDTTILDVNRRFLQHDYYTDIITFDECMGHMLRGDIYISLDTVHSNAEAYGDGDHAQELLRVIIHGVLHLCGINDKGPGEREIMEREENESLKLLSTIYK